MDDEIVFQVSIAVPRDSDGFIRRKCSHCEREFKWHDGPANAEAEAHTDPENYHCPLCGAPAPASAWITDEQATLAEQAAMPQMISIIDDELKSVFRGVRGVSYKKGDDVAPEQPEPLTEPDDMVIVSPPCHAYEPIKLPEDVPGPFHCLICGTAFAV